MESYNDIFIFQLHTPMYKTKVDKLKTFVTTNITRQVQLSTNKKDLVANCLKHLL